MLKNTNMNPNPLYIFLSREGNSLTHTIYSILVYLALHLSYFRGIHPHTNRYREGLYPCCLSIDLGVAMPTATDSNHRGCKLKKAVLRKVKLTVFSLFLSDKY